MFLILVEGITIIYGIPVDFLASWNMYVVVQV